MKALSFVALQTIFWARRPLRRDDYDRGLVERALSCIANSRDVLKRCRPAYLFDDHSAVWQSIATVPFGRNLELAVIEAGETSALIFPCRHGIGGWINVQTEKWVDVSPTHWRYWRAA